MAQDGPAEHVRQEHVQRHRGRLELPRKRQRLVAAHGEQHLEGLVAREIHENPRVMRVVLDDEQRRVARLDGVPVVFDFDRPFLKPHGGDRSLRRGGRVIDPPLQGGDRAGIPQRQVQRERAADARRAAQMNLPAEQIRQFAADRQTEAGAAVLAARARIGLLERLEDDALLLRRNADAGVGDFE